VSEDPAARALREAQRLLAAGGTQRRELGAFAELMRLGRLPSVATLRGRCHAGLAGLLET
jgi:hypothetical protein